MGRITNVARDEQEGQSAKTVGPASQRSLTWICLKAGWDWEAKDKGRDNPGGGRGGVGGVGNANNKSAVFPTLLSWNWPDFSEARG